MHRQLQDSKPAHSGKTNLQFGLVALIIVTLLLLVIAGQNAYPVQVHLFSWTVSLSLSILMAISFACGHGLALLLLGAHLLRGHARERSLRRRLAKLRSDEMDFADS